MEAARAQAGGYADALPDETYLYGSDPMFSLTVASTEWLANVTKTLLRFPVYTQVRTVLLRGYFSPQAK